MILWKAQSFFFVHRINIFFVSIPDLIPDVVSKLPAHEPPNYDYYNEEDYEDDDDVYWKKGS